MSFELDHMASEILEHIGSNKGLLPYQCQAINLTYAGLLSIESSGINF